MLAGDVVQYLGEVGWYLGDTQVRTGDTGVVIDVSKSTSHPADGMVSVRLFKQPDKTVVLPRGFWQIVK